MGIDRIISIYAPPLSPGPLAPDRSLRGLHICAHFSNNNRVLSKTIDEDVASQITIYDSGASAHMSPNWGRFTDFRSSEPKAVKVADKTIFLVTGVGHMKIDIPNGKDNISITLKDVLYCPELGYTLVSLAKCDTAGFTILLKDKTCCIKDPKETQISRIPQHQGLYIESLRMVL